MGSSALPMQPSCCTQQLCRRSQGVEGASSESDEIDWNRVLGSEGRPIGTEPQPPCARRIGRTHEEALYNVASTSIRSVDDSPCQNCPTEGP